MELILTLILNYLINLASNERSNTIHKNLDMKLKQEIERLENTKESLASSRSLRDEVSNACIELARKRDNIGVLPQEKFIWRLLSDEIFQSNFTEWLMAGDIEEGNEVKNRLLKTMEGALTLGGASQEQIVLFKENYFESLDKAIFAHPMLANWRHQLSLDYLREQVVSLRRYAEEAAGIYSPDKQKAVIDCYCKKALDTWDIIDLSNLPEDDVQMATQKLLLRQLYMPLRVTVEQGKFSESDDTFLDRLEEQRESRRYKEASYLLQKKADNPSHPTSRLSVGEQLRSSLHLVVLGDPGSGKTTMLRWMATAYLLKCNEDNTFSQIPDTRTLPDRDWIPVLIRCRDLGETDLCRCFADFLSQHLSKSELLPEEAAVMRVVILDRMAKGEALLLVDGLDEITSPHVRMMFCQELERTATRYPDSPIIVTSRIVGYRDMPYRMGSGFTHSVISELIREDKDLFAHRWIEVTEKHLPSDERTKRVKELLDALHSNDRIERLTGNPMLLTTLALVKRKVGKLPNRRNKLYSEAVSVLLNWNPRYYATIDEDEAIPQLEYLAYEMCRRGVQRFTEDEMLDLLDRLRIEYPNIRAIRRRPPQVFMELLESRSSIIIKSGGIWYKNAIKALPVWEFRHLTFQEYLAARALFDGRYPGRDKAKSLADQVAPLAGAVEVSQNNPYGNRIGSEVVVPESWREALRLLVSDCKDDDVDDVLRAILNPSVGEDSNKTKRPRAVLAALCLADEPNISEDTAQQVLIEFVDNVSKIDGHGNLKTTFDSAAIEISKSIWYPLFKNFMLNKYCQCPPSLRSNAGGILAMTEVTRLSSPTYDAQTCFRELLQNLLSANRNDVLISALTVMQLAFEQKSIILPGLVEALFELLDNDLPERHAASWALCWLNGWGYRRSLDSYHSQVPVLWSPTKGEFLKLVESLEKAPIEEEYDRRHIARIIRNVGYDKGKEITVQILLENLSSTDVDVRLAIIDSIGTLCDPQACDSMLCHLDDPNMTVQRAVVQALGQIGDKRAVEPLLNRLDDPDMTVKCAVVQALGQIGDKRAVEPLIALFKDENVNVRTFAAAALGNIKDPLVAQHLIALLAVDNVEVQRLAISTLNDYTKQIFVTGNMDYAAEIFKILHRQQSDVEITNNLSYCLIINKQYDEAKALYDSLECSKEDALFPYIQYNIGVLAYLMGDAETAEKHLRQAMMMCGGLKIMPLCMLYIDSDGHAISLSDLPFEAACLLNLYRVGGISFNDFSQELTQRYPDKYIELIAILNGKKANMD